MEGFDIFPYLTYYPTLQKPILTLVVIFNLFYHNGFKFPQIPFPLVLYKRSYDHTGLKQCLANSIQFYHETVDLKEKLQQYLIHLEKLVPEWKELEEEYSLLENDLQTLKTTLEHLTSAKKFMSPDIFDGIFIKLANVDMRNVVNLTKIMISKRDIFYTKVIYPNNLLSFDELNKLLLQYRTDPDTRIGRPLSKLIQQGLNLRPEGNEPSHPALFDISHMQELLELFEELERFIQIKEEERFTSLGNYIQSLDTLSQIEEIKIKYGEIPTTLKQHGSSLRQFSEWIYSNTWKINDLFNKIAQVFTQFNDGMKGFMIRTDKSLTKDVQQLYNNLRDSYT